MYAIGLRSVVFGTVDQAGRDLRKLSEATGGGYFELKHTDELGPTFTRVSQELHRFYLLGFAPEELDGKEHKLEVRLKQPTKRARTSYVAARERADEEPPLHVSRIERAGVPSPRRPRARRAAPGAAAARRRGRLRGGAAERRGAGGVRGAVATKFVVSPNAPVRQIWVSAMSRSYKLPWSSEAGAFALDGQPLAVVIDRLVRQFLRG